MSIAEDYQEWTITTAVYPEAGKYTERELNYLVHGLTGEAGELANKFKKLLRSSSLLLSSEQAINLKDEESKMLIDELGDVLWYASRLCEVLQTTVEAVMQDNVGKLEARKAANELKSHSS